jgi:competence protein ComEC
MKIWSRFPVFRFLIPFSTGILSCIYQLAELKVALCCFLAGFCLAWLFTTRNYATGKYAQRWLAGIPFYLFFYGAGFSYTWLYQSIHFKQHFKESVLSQNLIVEISDFPSLTKKGSRLITKVRFVKNNNRWESCSGKLLVNINDSLHKQVYNYGEMLLLNTTIQSIVKSKNPGAFDYARYLQSKNIWHNAYADTYSCAIISKGRPSDLFVLASMFRNLMLEKLQRYVNGKQESGVAGALLLGYEEWLDPETENSYSAAGVLHVLCVSGMHVGLIYVILAYALSWMEKKKWLRHCRYIFLLALIWFYAMVTGFSPSVIRASAMISFIIAGKWLNKDAGIYNLLCSSCFLMFLLNPYLIISAGFQLSFLAVCGIIFLHKRILPMFIAPNKWLHHLWELISISIAAQIATFPLSLFYFHQFPNYFLVANLLVIPLSTWVMYSGLLLLVTDWIPYCGALFGFITSKGITWLNYIVDFIGKLPGAITENLYLTLTETLLVYLLFVLILLWLTHKLHSLLFAVMIMFNLFLFVRISNLENAGDKKEFIVYESRKNSVMTIRYGRQILEISDLPIALPAQQDPIYPYRLECFVKSFKKTLLTEKQLLLIKTPSNNNIVLLKNIKRFHNLKPLQAKVLILSGRIDITLEDIIHNYHPGRLIADASVNKKTIERLKKEALLLRVNIHCVKEEGACRITL